MWAPVWDWIPSQNPETRHSRCVKYSFTTRLIKNETHNALPVIYSFRLLKQKMEKWERLKQGGGTIKLFYICLADL